MLLPLGAGVSRPVDFLLLRLGDLGRLLVMELLVALIKLELAALRIGVGSARRMRWEVGSELVGGDATCPPNTFIWEGGIHGARRWIRPRMC